MTDGAPPDEPPPPPSATEAAARIDLALPEACIAGVEANLALLAAHWRTLRGEFP